MRPKQKSEHLQKVEENGDNFQGKNPKESPSVILAHRFFVLETVKIHLIARDLSTADWALTQERKCIT